MANGHQPWVQAVIERCQFPSMLTLFSLIAVLCETQHYCCFGQRILAPELGHVEGIPDPMFKAVLWGKDFCRLRL